MQASVEPHSAVVPAINHATIGGLEKYPQAGSSDQLQYWASSGWRPIGYTLRKRSLITVMTATVTTIPNGENNVGRSRPCAGLSKAGLSKDGVMAMKSPNPF